MPLCNIAYKWKALDASQKHDDAVLVTKGTSDDRAARRRGNPSSPAAKGAAAGAGRRARAGRDGLTVKSEKCYLKSLAIDRGCARARRSLTVRADRARGRLDPREALLRREVYGDAAGGGDGARRRRRRRLGGCRGPRAGGRSGRWRRWRGLAARHREAARSGGACGRRDALARGAGRLFQAAHARGRKSARVLLEECAAVTRRRASGRQRPSVCGARSRLLAPRRGTGL